MSKTRLAATSGSGPVHCSCGLSRRGLLGGFLGGVAAAGTLASGRVAASAPAAGLIDIHHHITPPAYLAAIESKGVMSDKNRAWTIQQSLDDMDSAGVETAYVSVTAPGLWFGDADATQVLSRECNEYAAGLVRAYPGRFGSFAALPLPDIDASLREIAFAFDQLHADGVAMFTSYGGKALGDPLFTPVLEDLNRRRAIVFTHPIDTPCCAGLLPGVPNTVIEYGTDTSRTIASLLFSGAAARFPDIRFIFSHAGGTMPFLIERFEFFARSPAVARQLAGGDVRSAVSRFWFDVAQAANPVAMAALSRLVPSSRILFGTDFPYRTALEHVRTLPQCGFDPLTLDGIRRGNAMTLLAASQR